MQFDGACIVHRLGAYNERDRRREGGHRARSVSTYPLLELLDAALVDPLELLRQSEELAIEGANEVVERQNRLLHGLDRKSIKTYQSSSIFKESCQETTTWRTLGIHGVIKGNRCGLGESDSFHPK